MAIKKQTTVEKDKTKGKVKKVDGFSVNVKQERVEALKKLMPEMFADGKIDIKALKQMVGESSVTEGERYRLEWAGKSAVFDEIASRSSCTLTLDEKRSSKDFEKSNNIFIEGENLEVLRTLQKAYYNQVKMIYIDPPYNTGKDFVYNDNFRETEEEYGRDCENEDNKIYKKAYKLNSRDSGRFHSNWLSMMYPRLYMARNLLRDDGVIFVSIDDNEVHNLRMIMNEIFGEENFVSEIIWEKKTGASDVKTISTITEFVLVYTKNFDLAENIFSKNVKSYDLTRYKYKDEHFDVRGPYYIDNLDRGGLRYSDSLNYEIVSSDGKKTYPNGRNEYKNDGWIWKWSKDKVMWGIKNDFIVFKKSDNKKSGVGVYYKNYLNVDNEGNPIERAAPNKNLIKGIINANGASDMKLLFEDKVFDYPKPVDYIRYLLNLVRNDRDLILDFFSGSGTTAHCCHETKRRGWWESAKYICVQMPEETPSGSEAIKAGYKKISDIAIDRIKRAAKQIKKDHPDYQGDLGVRVYRESDSHFPQWHARAFETDEELKASTD
ncbi:MAG: site-specific DNA-methyltransferase [Candidatus Paceibacterota bacterium]